jgi:pimeloyl-ACP methyl ester carboxylesterase
MVRRGLEPGPRLRVESIPGGGHFLPEETPDAVLALVSEHLSSPQT